MRDRGELRDDLLGILAVAVEYCPDVMLVVDRDGTILQANARVEAMLGYTPTELVGTSVDTLVPDRYRAGHAKLRERFWEAPSCRPIGTGLDLSARRKDGSEVPVDISLNPVRFDGATMALVSVRDRSSRKAAEARFVQYFEHAPDALLAVDPAGRIALANLAAEKLFGYARADLLGQPVEILVPGRLATRHREERAAYDRAPRQRPMGVQRDLVALRRDGTEVPVDISLSPITTDRGTLVLAAVRDVTDRLRLEEAERLRLALEAEKQVIERAERLKGEFFTQMSHELRTPLASIIGYAELLEERESGKKVNETLLIDGILATSRHLLHLINDVLDLARVEAGKLRFFPEALDLGALVTDVRDILRPQALEKGITVECAVSPALDDIVTDPTRLKQVLLNYASNAVKFTPPGGKIAIRALPEGVDRFRIEVEDSGPGIQAKDVGRLFVAFERLDLGLGAEAPGTGLGLALSKRLVEGQGGEVGVRSVAGTGSTFHAVMPRRPRDFSPPSGEPWPLA